MRPFPLLPAALALALLAPATPAAPAPARPLRGTVLAADGAKAAGARVWAARQSYGPLEFRETRTDAQGQFSLDLGPGKWFLGASRGTQGAGGRMRFETVDVIAGQSPEPVTLTLEERGTLRGRLLEAETGKPIPGGRLALDDGPVLVADADGRFELGGLARGSHEVFVVAPGRQRLRVLFDTTARADSELDIPVPRGGKIVGRVTDLDGRPIPGAYVGRHTSGSFTSINALFEPCAPDGSFTYDDAVPPDQPTRLTASAPGYEDDESNRLLVPADGPAPRAEFRLRPKPTERAGARAPDGEPRRVVSGVIRGPDGQPREGVVVRWGYQPYVSALQTRTDKDGRFRLALVPDVAGMLAVLPRDLAPAFPHVPAGGDQVVELGLAPGHTARGAVRDDTGRPLAGVRVVAVIPSPDPQIGNPYWLTEAAVRTDSEGKFELKGIPDRARFDFLRPGLSDLRNHELKLDGADNAVTMGQVTMQYGGAIRGRVLDPAGRPVRNFRVLINMPHDLGPTDKAGGYFAGYCGTGLRFTSADGTFTVTGLVAGNLHRVTVVTDGAGGAEENRVAADPLNRLPPAEKLTLRLTPPQALRVRAVTAEGTPVANARVTLINGERGLDRQFSWGYHDASWEDMVRARTGADGRADFRGLSFGEATVLVQAPGRARQRLGWRNGAKELTVELAPEAVLAVEVRSAAGQPLREFSVSLLGANGDQINASAGPDDRGGLRLTELPAGAYTLSVRDSSGFKPLFQAPVTLKAGETQTQTIDVPPPG
jgi:hypothetical protein